MTNKSQWTVGDWMTRNPESVSPEMSVRNAFFRMRLEGFRHLLIVEDRQLRGIVTDRDLRRPDITSDPDGWNDFYHLEDDYEVRYVMTTDLVTVLPGDSLFKAAKLFLEKKFGALPVVDKKGSLIGILTTYDLTRAFVELDRTRRKLEKVIQAELASVPS